MIRSTYIHAWIILTSKIQTFKSLGSTFATIKYRFSPSICVCAHKVYLPVQLPISNTYLYIIDAHVFRYEFTKIYVHLCEKCVTCKCEKQRRVNILWILKKSGESVPFAQDELLPSSSKRQTRQPFTNMSLLWNTFVNRIFSGGIQTSPSTRIILIDVCSSACEQKICSASLRWWKEQKSNDRLFSCFLP